MKKNIVYIVVFFLMVWGCEECSRRCEWAEFFGSHGYAECYVFDAPEAEVIAAIQRVKTNNPSLQPPTQDSLIYSRKSIYREEAIMDDSSMQAYQEYRKENPLYDRYEWKMQQVEYPDYWLNIDFYYTDTNEIVHAETRSQNDSSKTTLAFFAISPLNQPTSFRLINRDFWYVANKMALNKFQKQIIDRIEEQLHSRKKK